MDIGRLDLLIRRCLWSGPRIATTADPPKGMQLVSVHFHVVGLDKAECLRSRNELILILNEYPEPERLAQGPSYIELGAEMGDQMMALMVMAIGMAIGEAADLWTVITPKTLHIGGAAADDLAGKGFVMISGYHPERVPATGS